MLLLEVKDLHVAFPRGKKGEVEALRGVDLVLEKGQRLGVVGESGAGKPMLAFAILNLIAEPGRVTQGSVTFDGHDLLGMSERQIKRIRGNRISMTFQDPMVTLNPVLSIGTQMIETLKAHRRISTREAHPSQRGEAEPRCHPLGRQPHGRLSARLSGGLRQRVVIAIALLTDPELIIADEPTTALDVTIQAEIMSLILRLCRENDVALILITHDLGVVAEVTERIMIMYAGKCVETGHTRDIIDAPKHPYAVGLLKALPQNSTKGAKLYQIPGSMPPITNPPSGCPYHPRCERATDECHAAMPPLERMAWPAFIRCT